MNARPMLSRIAAATFRRMCGLTTPITFTVPPSLGDPGTPARRYALADATGTPAARAITAPVPVSVLVKSDNRARFVHTSVSHDTAHAAENEGGPTPTDLPDTVQYQGRTYDRAFFERERVAYVEAFDFPGTLTDWLNGDRPVTYRRSSRKHV